MRAIWGYIKRHFLSSLREESGYTLAELNVAVLLGLLIAGLAFGSYLFVVKGYTNWETALELENSLHRALRIMSDDLRDAVSVETATDSTWSVQTHSVSKQYAIEQGVLLRNGRPIVPVSVAVMSLTIKVDSSGTPSSGTFSHQAAGSGGVLVSIAMSVQSGRHSLSGSATQALQSSALWTPLQGD
jgi:hypothetical protein